MVDLRRFFSKGSQSLGIELTPERVNIAHLSRHSQGIELQTLASVFVPEGAFENGRIVDVTAVADVIRAGLSDHKIKLKQVTSAVPVGEAVIRPIRLPAALDDFELQDMVLNQEAALYLPFPQEESDLDFQKLGTAVDEDGIERVEVLLVATPKEITETYLDTFLQAGLQLQVLEVSSFALIRTLREQLLQLSPGEAVAIVDIEFDSTEISIVMDGVPQFNRRVPIGTYELQNALGEALNLPESMAVDLLKTFSVSLEDTMGMQRDKSGNINPSQAAIRQVLVELMDEIRRSIDFYLNQGDTLEISQLFLAGPGAAVEQLDQFIEKRLGLPTTCIDPIADLAIQTNQEIPPQQRPGLGVVLGLGLRGL